MTNLIHWIYFLAKQNKVLHELCYVMWQQDTQFIEIKLKNCETQQDYGKKVVLQLTLQFSF